jgi:GNAT superfamily N-acetyltransferase
MTHALDRPLYDRAIATLTASWEAIARGSAGAGVRRLPGVIVAVFPSEPERAIYNNAVLDRDLSPDGRAAAIEATQVAYASTGIRQYAAWVHDTEADLAAELGSQGYAIAESTRVMGMSLDTLPPLSNEAAEIGAAGWAAYLGYLRNFGLSSTLLAGVDPDAFHVLAARLDRTLVATGLAFDYEGDCGIFNLSTLEPARRRGIGAALTARLLSDAADRGCETATLQSTPMAEHVYASLGFSDLGRFLEYAPSY